MKLFTNSIRSLLNNESKLLTALIWRTNAQIQPQQCRNYAAKKKVLTDAQLQVQKHAAEMGFKEKTTIRGTLYEFHDVETSIKYIKSEAFKTAYGEKLIWEWYIRNHKGRLPKSFTRQQCIGNGRYLTGNPCPICRDPYLVVNYKNLDLLRHFVSPDTGRLYPTAKTSVCRKQHENLEVAFSKACDYGLIDHYVPHRSYDYSKYYPELKKQNEDDKPSVLLGIVLGSKRQNINTILKDLKEENINLKD